MRSFLIPVGMALQMQMPKSVTVSSGLFCFHDKPTGRILQRKFHGRGSGGGGILCPILAEYLDKSAVGAIQCP